MPKRPLVPLLLVAGLLITGSLVSLSVPYSLTGQVVDAETTQPLAGAAVTMAGQSTSTGAQGAFELRGLRGLSVLRVEAPGYRPVDGVSLLGNMVGGRQPGVFQLQPVVVRGRVIDIETRAPVPGAVVQAGAVETQADGQGYYTLKRVRRGDSIMVRAPSYREAAPLPYEGQAVHNVVLALLPAAVTVQDACSGKPIAGAEVSAGGTTLQSDGQGHVAFARLAPHAPVQATYSGYDAAVGTIGPGESLVLGLRPGVLRGTVFGAEGRPLANALVLARMPGHEPRLTRTDAAGQYQIDCAPAGATLTVRLAGYRKLEQQVGSERTADVRLEPFVAKGIYLPIGLLHPSARAQLQANLDLVDRSELNAVVVEVKTQYGSLAFAPALPLAREIGAQISDEIDVRALIAECKQRGIYTIARMTVFEDDVLASKRPEWAVHHGSGAVWRADGGCAWTDPFRQEVRAYNIAVAREAAELGFDEIQFDYVRFPSDGVIGDCRYLRESTPATRVEAINSFLAEARGELDKAGAFLSADLFGLTTFSDDETGIGQLLDQVAPHLDYVSPMVYPSTYVAGMLGVADPWRSPFEIVKLSLVAARQKTGTLIRPWLQHFDDYHGLGIGYGPREVRLQKQAALEGQSSGWLFWNPGGEYDPASFDLR